MATSPEAFFCRAVIDLTQPTDDVMGYCWPLGLSTPHLAGYATPNGPCEAFRINGINVGTWQATDSRVLRAGAKGEFDDQGFVSLATAELDGTHYMFYVEGAEQLQGDQEPFLGNGDLRGRHQLDQDGEKIPVHMTQQGMVTAVAAHTVGDRIHLWITDEYDGASGVGYFLFDPNRSE